MIISELSRNRIKGLSNSSLAVLKIIAGNSSITIKGIARNLHLSERMVGKHIQKLKAIGAIIRIGGDKGGRWKLKFQSSHETTRDSSG
jgi:ATP-dependent DNA helicase RecG